MHIEGCDAHSEAIMHPLHMNWKRVSLVGKYWPREPAEKIAGVPRALSPEVHCGNESCRRCLSPAQRERAKAPSLGVYTEPCSTFPVERRNNNIGPGSKCRNVLLRDLNQAIHEAWMTHHSAIPSYFVDVFPFILFFLFLFSSPLLLR